jgi:hypothetical protein
MIARKSWAPWFPLAKGFGYEQLQQRASSAAQQAGYEPAARLEFWQVRPKP